jgi:ADP-heptose:LPS heptosyltransferase
MSFVTDVYQVLSRHKQLRIAVVRALPGLGDFLCAVPAFRALRTAFPKAHIAIVGLPSTQELVQRFDHYLDDWLEFPGFPGIPEVPFLSERTALFLKQMKSRQFDLVLQMHGNGSSINPFIFQFEAKFNAGFFPPMQHCPDSQGFLAYPEENAEVWRLLGLLEFLGIPAQGAHLEFPLKSSDWQLWSALVENYQFHNHYVCLHPGASVGDKRWSPKHFAQVADGLASQGWQIVLTGIESESELTYAVAEEMRFSAINLAGQTNLGTLAILLKNASLLICNDTGVSHLADALQTDSVVIFSNSDPQRWAPLDQRKHRIVGGNKSHNLTPEIVLQEASELLRQEIVYVS